MGEMTRLSYSVLDSLIESRGHEWLRDQLMDRLVEGQRPMEIAQSLGLKWVTLRGWIEQNCPDAIALAGRARADELEWKATQAVEYADQETVSVAKLQADHFMKLAAKLDRVKYGDRDPTNGGGGITVVVERGGVCLVGNAQDKGDPVPEIPRLVEGVEL